VHRALDVLDRSFADIFELGGDLAGHLVAHRSRQRHATGMRQRLQARRHVHALAVDVVALDDDVAQIDPDAIADAHPLGHFGVPRGDGVLDFDGACHGRHDGSEFHQRAVAHQFHDAPAVLGHLGIEDGAAVGLEPLERSRLVALHHAAVANDIGGQNGGQFALHAGNLGRVCAQFRPLALRTLRLSPPIS